MFNVSCQPSQIYAGTYSSIIWMGRNITRQGAKSSKIINIGHALKMGVICVLVVYFRS